MPRPLGWLRDERQPGKISTRIHPGDNDPGRFGENDCLRGFGYTFFVTGSRRVTIRNKEFTEPTIVPSGEKRLAWLRSNALTSKGQAWFAVAYGPFRRLSHSSQIMVPTLAPQSRYTNFLTLFSEDEALSIFERWMVYLDYRIAKEQDQEAKRVRDIGVAAIDRLLPKGVKLDGVSTEGGVHLEIQGERVPTIALSDGYRSMLALAGDLVWRLISAFPDSEDPCQEEGVVLIDELDIHLHPVWQRDITGLLKEQFPNLQFIVATHSPLVAAAAGEDALTLCFSLVKGRAVVESVADVSAMNVDRVLQSQAFGLRSPYSPETQRQLDRHDVLAANQQRTSAEEEELEHLLGFMEQARPLGGPPPPGSLEHRMERYLREKLS